YERMKSVYAMIAVESGYNPRAISSKDAIGLMQITPIAVLDAIRECNVHAPSREQLFQPLLNVKIGSCFLRHLLKMYGDDMVLALAHYNGGGRQVEKIRRGEAPVPETANYILKVLYVRSVCTDKEALTRVGHEALPWEPAHTQGGAS